MSKISHNIARRGLPDPEGTSKPDLKFSKIGKTLSDLGNRVISEVKAHSERSELARTCLASNYATPKEWGADLGVSDRLIRMWINSEALIPESRINQIILQAHNYKIKNRDLDTEIDAAIDEMLAQAYGPGGNKSM